MMDLDDVVFEWIGEIVECNNPGLKQNNQYTYYKLNGECYNINDFAMVEYEHTLSVCKLLTIYQSDMSCHNLNKYRASVRWYSFLHDLPKEIQEDVIADDLNEVVEDLRFVRFISLDTISRKCYVISGPNNLTLHKEFDKTKHFYCRFTLEKNTLMPKLDEDISTYANKSPNIDSTPKNYRQTKNIQESFNMEKILSPVNLNKPAKLTPNHAKRNLNESFNNTPKSQCENSFLNYSIVDQQDNSLKIKLRVSENNPKVLLERLDDKILSQKKISKRRVSFSDNDIVKDEPNAIIYPDTIEEMDTLGKVNIVRRSCRTVSRRSYVDYNSPRKRSNSIESEISIKKITGKSTSQTPQKNKLRTRSKSTFEQDIGSLYEDTKQKTPRKCTMNVDYTDVFSVNMRMRNLSIDSDIKVQTTPRPRRESIKPKRYIEDSVENEAFSPTKLGSSPRKKVKDIHFNNQCDTEYIPFDSGSVILKTPKKNSRNTSTVRTPKNNYTPRSPKINYSPRTPKNTPLKEQLMKSGNRIKLIREGVITPSIQCRETVILKDNTPLKKARTKLHVSYVPKALPCREKEFDDILGFIEGKLLDGCGGCMYVSGVPGTGKTATVTEVINKLDELVKHKHVPNFEYVCINGMRLTEPRQSYVEILKQLTGKTVAWEQAQTMLENKFTKKSSGKKQLPIVLLVDELDILCTKRQDVVYNLLDWPTKVSAQLIVITIANTMDLPERLLMGRVTSRLGLTRLTFQAYTHKQLQEIVTKRLTGTNAFNPDAIQLVARKVASVSGDARRALDICRRAAEIAELEGPKTLVSMGHVSEALDAMITQPKVRAIKQCARLEQLLLEAICQEVQRTGVEETTFSDVFTMLPSIAGIHGFSMVSCTLALAAISRLGACRLLLTEQKSNDLHQKLILNVSPDDIHYALQ